MNISNIQGRVILGVWAFALVLLGAPLLFAMSVDTVPDPRAEDGWVSDTIGLIEPERRLRLNQKLSALEQQTEVEVALVVVEAVDTATPKDFATQLFNHWKLGKASQNNGLLILLVHGEKRLEMETGYGLETVLTDGWLKRVQMREMVPAFKADRYGQGLEVGVDAVIQHLTDNLGALEHAAENPQRQAPRPHALGAMSVAAVPNPRLTNEWISDTIGLLSGQQKGRLNKKLNALQRDTDVEFVVVIVKAIDTASPAEFATQLFEQWNFGDAAQNNGLLLFVFDEKHLEVEFGHGLETVFTDDWVKSMETRVLQESRSDLRLEVGAHLVIRQIEAQKSVREPTKGKRSAPWWAWALGVLLTGGVSFFGFSRLRAATKRFQYTLDRTCKDCNKPMTLASDEEAAPHLAPGQRVEIELGTAIYQYYSCSDCAHRRVFREEKVVPRVLLCRQCQYWTLTYSSKEIGANGGQFETVLDCQNCDYTSSSILNLSDYPTLPPNDDTYGGGGSGGGYNGGSSSGGSTGGFGGGSSGGGGAGSSW